MIRLNPQHEAINNMFIPNITAEGLAREIVSRAKFYLDYCYPSYIK